MECKQNKEHARRSVFAGIASLGVACCAQLIVRQPRAYAQDSQSRSSSHSLRDGAIAACS